MKDSHSVLHIKLLLVKGFVNLDEPTADVISSLKAEDLDNPFVMGILTATIDNILEHRIHLIQEDEIALCQPITAEQAIQLANRIGDNLVAWATFKAAKELLLHSLNEIANEVEKEAYQELFISEANDLKL